MSQTLQLPLLSWKVLPKQTFLLPFKLCQANFVVAFLLLD